jgi:hypothetical protein
LPKEKHSNDPDIMSHIGDLIWLFIT